MNFIEFTAGQNDENRRLDKVLRILINQDSLSQIYSALRKGLIKVNNKKQKPEYKIQKDDVIKIADFLINNDNNNFLKLDNSNNYKNKTEFKIEDLILLQNENFLFLNKPVGLNVQSSTKNDISLDSLVKEYVSKNPKFNDSLSFRTGPLHRIDKMTSGIITFSLSTKGAVEFSKILQNHQIKKTYYAVFQGEISTDEEWIDYLTKPETTDDDFNKAKTTFHKVEITTNDEDKKCITRVYPIAQGFYRSIKITFAKVQIETGRQHQIRAQGSFHNHPLIGDDIYGGIKLPEKNCKYFLHAQSLVFPQNEIDLPLKIEAPLPQRFKNFIIKYCDMKKIEL